MVCCISGPVVVTLFLTPLPESHSSYLSNSTVFVELTILKTKFTLRVVYNIMHCLENATRGGLSNRLTLYEHICLQILIFLVVLYYHKLNVAL